VAEQTRRNSGGRQPISQHPLFPAIVALWFGALSGLCSLALKPALLESLVVAAGIDSIIPMAAPPLGTTTRILLALAMTGLGGVIGALLARRIARPAPQVRERRRGASGSDTAAAKHAAASPAPQSNFTGRRRALALHDESARDEFNDHAPVPGRESGILDVSELELDGFEDVGGPSTNHDAARLDDAEPLDQADDLWIGAQTGFEAEAPRDNPFSAPALPEGAQVFSPLPEAPAAASHDAEPVAVEQGPKALGNSLFATYSQQIADRAERAHSATPNRLFDTDSPDATEEAEPGFELLPRMNLGDWGDDDADSDTDGLIGEAAPLFPTRESLRNTNQPKPEIVQVAPEGADDGMSALVAFAAVEPAPEGGAEGGPDDAAGDTFARTFDAPGAVDSEDTPAQALRTEPEDADAGAAITAETACESQDSRANTAAERLSSTELGELSQIELLERLALAMASRREEVQARQAAEEARAQAEAEAAAVAAAEAAAAKAAAQAAGSPEPSEGAHAPGVPTDTDVEPEVAAVDLPRLEITPLEVEPLTFAAPTFAAPAQDAEPAAAEAEAEAEAEAAEPSVPTAPVNRLPAALRPVGYDDVDEADDGLPGYIPPRHIGMTASANPLADMAEDEAGEADDDETRVLEEGYSSLLNLSRPAAPQPGFVRIEEPESDEIEPVVIFPGEEPRLAGGPFANPAPVEQAPAQPASAKAPGEARLFDAPAKANAEETERALRAALATLQRMSGAA